MDVQAGQDRVCRRKEECLVSSAAVDSDEALGSQGSSLPKPSDSCSTPTQTRRGFGSGVVRTCNVYAEFTAAEETADPIHPVHLGRCSLSSVRACRWVCVWVMLVGVKSVVAIVRCEDYELGNVRQAVREAIRLCGLGDRFAVGKRVLLKPNLLSARKPEDAVTTHPSIVCAVGELAEEVGCVVRVGDSPPFAGETSGGYRKLLRETGMLDAAEAIPAEIVRFEESAIDVPDPDGKALRTVPIAQVVVSADLVVNIPKCKTHGLTTFSGAVKNVFGCVPGARKGLYHAQAGEDPVAFAQMMVDIYAAVRPGLSVMDAVVAMDGDGPNRGTPKQVGLILASPDAVALDAVALSALGRDPMSVDMVRLAHEQGIGCGSLADIEVAGLSLDSARVSAFSFPDYRNPWRVIPRLLRQPLRRQLFAFPRINRKECIGCGKCSKICPAQAIAPGQPPTIDLAKCIMCYCCQEVCDESAIDLRENVLGRIVRRVVRR
jgi:uncharacterized protein (DUF362 family)/ferredoxin